ncbi:MAG: hypothetical protein O2971_02525 [Proteobacteria bacterium]|nr:hypothetical protein [Pseudomonadota bacterium]
MFRQGLPVVVGAALVLAFTSSSVFSQSINQNLGSYLTEKTAWGHPNLQGVWDRRTITPLERPARFADKPFLTPEEIRAYERDSAARGDGRPLDSGRAGISVHDPADLDYGVNVLPGGQTSLVVSPSDGRIPAYTEAAQARAAREARAREGRGAADSWTDRSLTERCLTWGMPQGMLPQAYNNNIQIIQTPTEVMILTEMVHDVRIIPIDGRPHLPAGVTQWHGDSRGHWEGETLVVESQNFSAKSSFRRSNVNLHLEERFTRTADDMLQYGFSVTDETTWDRPWSVSFPMLRGDQPMYEFACHEGNYGLLNILTVARNLEKQAANN